MPAGQPMFASAYQWQPPAGPQMPAGPPRRSFLVPALVLLALVLAGSGVAAWFFTQDHGSSGGSNESTVAEWKVGSCVWISSQLSYSFTGSISPEKQAMLDSAKKYEPISCSDSRAFAKITALGATSATSKEESGCPEDSDLVLQSASQFSTTSSGQIYCTRLLKGPHPGDVGEGGGSIVVGDCVYVSSSNGSKPLNDRVTELPCSGTWYAKVLAKTQTAAACPADTLSRIALPQNTTTVLCLGQAGNGRIAAVGQCINIPANKYYPAERIDCSKSAVVTLVSIVDSASGCAAGTHAIQYTGYDRVLCIRYPDGS